MAQQINFVAQRRKKFTKTQEQDRVILRFTAIVLAFVVISTGITLGVRIWLGMAMASTKNQLEQVTQSLTLNQQSEQTYLILLNKLSSLTTILTQRQDKQRALDYFTSLFGDQVILTEITYDDQVQILSLGLEATDVFVFEEVIKTLESGSTAQRYPQIGKSELNRDGTGAYSMNLAIQLGAEESAQVDVSATSPTGDVQSGGN